MKRASAILAGTAMMLLLIQQGHAATGCRTDDELRLYQECPVYETPLVLEVNSMGELCSTSQSFAVVGQCNQSGRVVASGIVNGARYEYEARSIRIGSKRWEILSVSPEPPNDNRWPMDIGSIESQTIAQGETISIEADRYFEDPDEDDLAFEVVSFDSLLGYEEEVGDSTVTITIDAVGYHKFTIWAHDPGGLFSTQDFFVDVIARHEPVVHVVPLFVSAWNSSSGQQGYVRIINRTDLDGEFTITAIDDEGTRAEDTNTITIAAGQAVHFNADDLEMGNAGKGIVNPVGRGQGDWRLKVESTLDLHVLAYMRTSDGFVTSLVDLVPMEDGTHEVVYFNPGSNFNQVSKLRIVNLEDQEAAVDVTGIDDRGTETEVVRIIVPASGARTISAQDLESGVGVEGSLGDGSGKWRLTVESDRMIRVMSVLESPAGHLTNLSTIER